MGVDHAERQDGNSNDFSGFQCELPSLTVALDWFSPNQLLFCTISHKTDGGKGFMQNRKKPGAQGGRPRKFDEGEALGKIKRQLWTTGLSGASLDSIARSAGLNRPSLAAAFGGKDAIYAQVAAQYVAMIDERLRDVLEYEDLAIALTEAFDAAIEIYTADGADGCFVICTAPAEALTNPVCRNILDQSLNAIDALFLRRLKRERTRGAANPSDLSVLAAQLGATLHSVALRARAGWARDRLQRLASGTIRHVVASVGHSQVRERGSKLDRTKRLTG
jgi:AcrR family transcriptional regulator